MKAETKVSGPCRVKLAVRAEATETRPDYEKIVGEYVQHGRLPGFRAGKAPRALVETRYSKEIAADVRSKLISRFYHEAIKETTLTPVAVLDVTDVLFTPSTGISFVALVDVVPEFKLPKYKKIPLQVEAPVVPEEQVNAQLGRFRDMLAKLEDGADQPAARNDFVQIDFTATCEGRPLQDVVPEAAALATATDFLVQVAEPENIPGLGIALEGAKKGDQKAVPVAFDKNYHVEALRGKAAVYQVLVKAVRQRILPTDEVVCQRAGFANLDEMRAQISKNLLAAAERQELARQQKEVVEFLLKRTEFELPESVVTEETNHTIRAMMRDVIDRGGTREDLAKNRDSILETATTASKDRVRLRYILARIAADEKITVTPAEVNQRLEELAAQYRMPVKKVRETMEARHGLETLISDMRSEKALSMLVADAKAR